MEYIDNFDHQNTFVTHVINCIINNPKLITALVRILKLQKYLYSQNQVHNSLTKTLNKHQISTFYVINTHI